MAMLTRFNCYDYVLLIKDENNPKTRTKKTFERH
jgi:hypothetical protein